MKYTSQTYIDLTAIQAGAVFCVPAFMLGYMLTTKYGVTSSLISIIIANLILTMLGLCFAVLSVRRPCNTIEQVLHYFGVHGTWLYGLGIIMCLVFWFSIQQNIMVNTIIEFPLLKMKDLPYVFVATNCIIGFAITLLVSRGITALKSFANIATPFLIIVMIIAILQLSYKHTLPDIIFTSSMTLKGVPLIIAASLGAIFDIPTYYRFARTNLDAYVSVILTFFICYFFVIGTGVYFALCVPDSSFIEVLLSSGNDLWKLLCIPSIILLCWTTNNLNLYSAGVNVNFLLPKVSLPFCITIIGIVGTVLSCTNIILKFEELLNVITIVIGSQGSVIVTCFVLDKLQPIQYTSSGQKTNLICAIFGIIYGLLSLLKVHDITTGFIYTDAAIVSSFAVLCTRTFLFIYKNYCEENKPTNSQ
ncbi:cytosine permease [Wolbachia endosymbiont (group A) of Cheilosia soror]|uniref:cytosine permease n=1 Tax=Wolbachia endosymbiont (group A) of Cheilosia soror TaxID=2953995 RepID=UPI0021F86CBE|nr:cytosine permease [Wolbachia endosymbiont (group A) of Cheilosia soror]